MSASPDPRPGDGDGGFSLVEVIVALGLFLVVVAAVLPQLIIGLRSTDVARQVSDSKALAQGELERMRNLPFHISPDAGPYVDVLDNFFRNLLPPSAAPACTGGNGRDLPPPVSATGYVAAGVARCRYEPPAGTAFFRTVRAQPSVGQVGGYTIVTDTQFLSDATPPTAVGPRAGYDSQVTGKDLPPASQIGVTVTVLASRQPARRPVSVFTQIGTRPESTTLVQGRVDVRALDVGSVVLHPTVIDRAPLALASGVLSLSGSVATSSTMTASRGAVTATLGSAPQTYGLTAVDGSPPASATTQAGAGAAQLPSGCGHACWGSSFLNAVPMSAAGGLPQAGSSAAPVRSVLSGTDNRGLSFGNALDPGDYRPALDLPGNLVQADPGPRTARTVPSCAWDGTSPVAGAGFVTTTPTGVSTCAAASTGIVELFPTRLVPRGLVRVELVAASASCQVSGPAHAATAGFDYQVAVSYWDQAAGPTGGYRSVVVTKATSTDVLGALDLGTIRVGPTLHLGDYIASWSSLTPARVKTTATGGVADVGLPGVVTIATRPTRTDPTLTAPGDQPSVVSLAVGALSCHAEDHR